MQRPADPSQSGLFVIWEHSRPEEKRILADLNRHFEMLSVQEVHWSPRLAERNFERFYSDLNVRGLNHVFNKGAGPFLAVRVVDRSPAQENRMTSRGPRTVNSRFLDAKLRYRKWKAGLGVHCGETTWETRRDLKMLLGVDESGERETNERWNGEVKVLHRDVTGARGWDSKHEAIAALNVSVDYVVIGDPASSAGTALMSRSRPTQFLTDEYHALYTVLNASPVLGSPPPHGGNFVVSIAGRNILVGLRVVGDGFIDPVWARHCLAARELDKGGVYRTSALDALATFCYRALVHSPRLTADDKAHMAAMARPLGLAGWSMSELADPRLVKERLDDLLHSRGISYVRPRDTSLFVNFHALGSSRPHASRAAWAARRWRYLLVRGSVGFTTAHYIRVRSRILRRVPALRGLKRALAGWKH